MTQLTQQQIERMNRYIHLHGHGPQIREQWEKARDDWELDRVAPHQMLALVALALALWLRSERLKAPTLREANRAGPRKLN